MEIRVIMRGCNGKMGQVISGIIESDSDCKIVAGVDVYDEGKNSYPVYSDFKTIKEEADVIIDFASPNSFEEMLEYSEANNVPAVICTTGLSEEQINKLEETSKKTAMLRSANMSLGINTLIKLLQSTSKLLSDAGFDIEIIEKHHNQKLDAPSGTALALADAVNSSLDEEFAYKYDRSGDRMKRPKKEIGISAVRGGTIVGEHEVIFAGTDEVIEIKHTAYSKAIFGKGAVQAAKFLAKKPAGMYDMSNVIDAETK